MDVSFNQPTVHCTVEIKFCYVFFTQLVVRTILRIRNMHIFNVQDVKKLRNVEWKDEFRNFYGDVIKQIKSHHDFCKRAHT